MQKNSVLGTARNLGGKGVPELVFAVLLIRLCFTPAKAWQVTPARSLPLAGDGFVPADTERTPTE